MIAQQVNVRVLKMLVVYVSIYKLVAHPQTHNRACVQLTSPSELMTSDNNDEEELSGREDANLKRFVILRISLYS